MHLRPDAPSAVHKQRCMCIRVCPAGPVQEFCPCGERCSNQMFTRREYAALEVVRTGCELQATSLHGADAQQQQEQQQQRQQVEFAWVAARRSASSSKQGFRSILCQPITLREQLLAGAVGEQRLGPGWRPHPPARRHAALGPCPAFQPFMNVALPGLSSAAARGCQGVWAVHVQGAQGGGLHHRVHWGGTGGGGVPPQVMNGTAHA